jgi:hypothetical protein
MSGTLSDAAMIRFLRHLGRNPAFFRHIGSDVWIHANRGEGREQHHPQTIVEVSMSSGLVVTVQNTLQATREASAFLRRAMVKDREEIFQEQHRDPEFVRLDVEGVQQSVCRNATTSPLASFYRLKDRDGRAFFSADALQAGERFASDFHRGHLNPRVTASWEPRLSKRTKGTAGAVTELNDTAMSARLRFTRAADAMGPELSGIAIDVCCFEKGLEMVERERLWPVRSAKLMLRTALLALTRHYAPPSAPGQRMHHHWGAEDYRPIL